MEYQRVGEKMEKKELLDTFTQLEAQSRESLESMAILKNEVSRLVAENQSLRLENKNLRDQLDVQLNKEAESTDRGSEANRMTRSRQNLESIYEDGFHVCNMFFGQRRNDDESCAFCLDVIYGKRR